MKPVISVYYDDNANPIVVLSKNIADLENYEKARETRKFYTNEVKQLESTVEYLIIDILNELGVIPYDDTDEALESAFRKLYKDYGKTIKIIDEYENYKGKIVHRKLNQTCIEEDSELSIANKIVVCDYGD